MCPHYQVGNNEYLQLITDAKRLDIPFSGYSSKKPNRHKCSGFLHAVNHGTEDYDKFFGTNEEVMAVICAAVEMVLNRYGARKKHCMKEDDKPTELLSLQKGEENSPDFDGPWCVSKGSGVV